MDHIIYKIFDEYGFDKCDGFELEMRIRRLNNTDYDTILTQLDNWYRSNNEEILRINSSDKGLNSVWFPKFQCENIDELSGRFIYADKLIIDDTLFNYFVYAEESFISNLIEGVNKNLSKEYLDFIQFSAQEKTFHEISRLIKIYKNIKDLVIDDRVIIYADMKVPSTASSLMESDFFNGLIIDDDSTKSLTKAFDDVFGHNKIAPNILKSYSKLLIDTYFDCMNLFGVLSLYVLSPNLPSTSMDLLDDKTPKMLNSLLLKYSQQEERTPTKTILTPFSQNCIPIPSILGLPMDEVLEIKEKEKEAFDSFRDDILNRISNINSNPGSKEWEKEIYSIRLDIKKEVKDISKLLSVLKKDYSRKFALELAKATISIAVASFPFISQQPSVISSLPTIVGGAGVISSLQKISLDWATLQKDIDEIKSRPTYFLWKMKKNT